jgi:peptide subunit release factor RF-3
MDPNHRDRMAFLRICSGKYEKNMTVNHMRIGKKITLAQPQQFMAQDRNIVEEAYAGDIIALAGLKDTTTGDTLCDEAHPIVLENMVFPEPVIQLAVEPKTKADVEKMGLALGRWLWKIRLSKLLPIRTAVKPLLPVWANCTSTLLLTV